MVPYEMPAWGYALDYVAFWLLFLVAAFVGWRFVRAGRGRPGGARRRRLVVGNLLVLLALALGVALAAETWLRFFAEMTESYGLTLTTRAWFTRHYRLNSWGFRERELVDEKPPDVTRIAFVGDSFLAGYGITDPADRLTERLQAILDGRPGPGRSEVWNLGIVGTETGEHDAIVRNLLGRTPVDRVVLVYCLNDISHQLPKERHVDRDAMPRAWSLPRTTSFLLDQLWFRFVLACRPDVGQYYDFVEEAYADPGVWARQQQRFESIAATCRGSSAGLDVVVFPFVGRWGPDYRFHAAHDALTAAWTALGARVVDLRTTYQGMDAEDLVVGRYDAHPNERAHALAAEAIARQLF